MKNNRSPIVRFIAANYRAAVILLGLGILIFLFFGSETVLGLKPAPIELVVYASSAQEEALMEGIIPAFKEVYQNETGNTVEVEAVFSPSTTLAGKIIQGADVHLAICSSEYQVNLLKAGGLVYRETVPVQLGFSPMVIVTRQGNPHGISDYPDLGNPGLQLLHADPRSSGAGQWALLAEYGSVLLDTSDRGEAEEQLRDIWHNVELLGSSSRASLNQFEMGSGDALVIYEQEALYAQERQYPLEIVTPPYTLIAQPTAVIIDSNVSTNERKAAQAMINFMAGEQGQEILSRFYLHPVDELNLNTLKDTGFFTVDELGGWQQAYGEEVELFWFYEIEPNLELIPSPILEKQQDNE